MNAEFVICKECIYWEDCFNKENRDGCYFGEKSAEKEANTQRIRSGLLNVMIERKCFNERKLQF